MENNFFTYKIPKHIKEKIPNNFYLFFLSKLYEAEGIEDRESLVNYLDYCEGTYGWAKVLKSSLIESGCRDIWKYYNKLPWYDSDLFDYEIGEEILKYYDGGSSND